jgi:hypothetical protein
MGSWLMFGAGTDDEDTLFRYYDRVTNDILVTISPFKIAREIADLRPLAARQVLRIIDSLSLMTWSSSMYLIGEDGALTNEGVIRGWRDFQRSLPALSVLRKFQYDLEN